MYEAEAAGSEKVAHDDDSDLLRQQQGYQPTLPSNEIFERATRSAEEQTKGGQYP